MSVIEVEQVIYDCYRRGKSTAFAKSPEDFLRTYNLSQDERDFILKRDLNGLYDLGVHPMLVMYFARMAGLSVPEYLQILREHGAA